MLRATNQTGGDNTAEGADSDDDCIALSEEEVRQIRAHNPTDSGPALDTLAQVVEMA